VERSVWFVTLIFGLLVASPASAQIYQWKDKDGKTYFSDRPPQNQSDVQVKGSKRAQPEADPDPDETEVAVDAAEDAEDGVKSNKAAVAAPAPVKEKTPAEQRNEEFRKRRAAAAEAREKAEQEAASNEQRRQDCQRARAQYSVLNSGQRVFQPTEDGGRKILEGEERVAEIGRTEELIKVFCDKD
jgi:hypothetical protein